MTAMFVTATGTDVGKTFVARGLIRQLRARGLAVDALKPVITGYDPQTAHLSDTGRLLAALGRALTPRQINQCSPVRLREPLPAVVFAAVLAAAVFVVGLLWGPLNDAGEKGVGPPQESGVRSQGAGVRSQGAADSPAVQARVLDF